MAEKKAIIYSIYTNLELGQCVDQASGQSQIPRCFHRHGSRNDFRRQFTKPTLNPEISTYMWKYSIYVWSVVCGLPQNFLPAEKCRILVRNISSYTCANKSHKDMNMLPDNLRVVARKTWPLCCPWWLKRPNVRCYNPPRWLGCDFCSHSRQNV